MTFMGDSLKELATENMWIPTQPDFLQMKELEDTLDLVHLAVAYHFDAARLDGRSYHGIPELQSSLSDY